MSKLFKNRSNRSVSGKETGTGGLVKEILCRILKSRRVMDVDNKAGSGTVPHRYRTIVAYSSFYSLRGKMEQVRGRLSYKLSGSSGNFGLRTSLVKNNRMRYISATATEGAIFVVRAISGKVFSVGRGVDYVIR